ncbi:MAG: UvrD-helicase domain-containing protein [Myxococcales bacterium]|nr:UvrD-helicase domain-containing protein [Myxococcales bacterium]
MSAAVDADRAARNLAQREYVHPVALQAGAGTGKTAVLVARVCVWSLGEGWELAVRRLADRGGDASPERLASETFRRVVAITFTEAAAAEMAVRVGTALLELQAGDPVVGIDRAALPAADVLQVRARALVGALDQLGVRTIHAFCRRLLSAHALEAGLHPRFQVDAGGGALEAVAREVMESHLQRAYGEPGEADARELAATGFGPPEVEQALLLFLREGVAPEQLAADPVGPVAAANYLREFENVLRAFFHVEGGAFRELPARRVAPNALLALDEAFALVRSFVPESRLVGLGEALSEIVEEKYLKRLKAWSRGRLESAEEQRAWPAEIGPLAESAAHVVRWLEHARSLDPDRLALGMRVLAPLLGEARDLLRRRGIQTFSALLQDTERLLRSSPDVAARVRRETDQLLVDEFQDTDALQCEIVRHLALTGPMEERPGLFVVGDPKQSIYGWRNADLRAYEDFIAAMQAEGGAAGSLCVNHRSVPAVLDAVEQIVGPVMEAVPGVQPAFEPLVPCERLAGNPGFRGARAAAVEHWVSWEWNAETHEPNRELRAPEVLALEARAVARDLESLHREEGVSWGSVALLFRSLADADVYLEELRRAGVPYVVERDRHYYDRREVIDASALVRALLDPHDQVALVAALRSSAVGVPDAAWVPLWERRFPEHFAGWVAGVGDGGALETLVREAASEVPTDVPQIERVDGWVECLVDFVRAAAELRKALATEPPDEFVERLRSTLRFEVSEASRSLGHFRVANLDRFFRDLRAALEAAHGDLAHVLAALRHSVSEAREQEEGRPRPAGNDAVRVLTIHGAKGLQFEHVYVLQLQKTHGNRPKREAAVDRRGALTALRLFEQETLEAPAVQADTDRVDAAEAVRTLYVAMTRAEKRLVLAGKLPAGKRSTREGHADWVAQSAERAGGDLEAWMAGAAAGDSFARDEEGVRWVFPALDSSPQPSARRRATAAPEDGLRERAAELDARRQAARERAARPTSVAASDGEAGADELSERAAARYGDSEGEGDGAHPPDASGASHDSATWLERGEARAVGTAIHAALEVLDGGAAPEAARRSLDEALSQWLPLGASAAARKRAQALLDGFLASPLYARARELTPHVVARELPVLLPPAADADALGFVAGAADLVYRDPQTREFVVADYKTDAVSAAGLEAHAERHRAQGQVYVQAVRDALGLAEAPRFELWFLAPGEIVTHI